MTHCAHRIPLSDVCTPRHRRRRCRRGRGGFDAVRRRVAACLRWLSKVRDAENRLRRLHLFSPLPSPSAAPTGVDDTLHLGITTTLQCNVLLYIGNLTNSI